MPGLANNKKGFILVTAALAIAAVLGLTAALILRSVSEKRVVDVEKFIMQAGSLAEAGANHGLAELRKRIGTDLDSRISQVTKSETIRDYCEQGTNGALQLLSDYAYASGNPPFTVVGDEAMVLISALNIVSNINGSYASQIIVTAPSAPQETQDDVFVFYYNYEITGTGTSLGVSPSINKQVTLLGSFNITLQPFNFANYALFTTHHISPTGEIVWFTGNTNFYGPVHTNDYFSFGYNPSGHFTHLVTQHEQTARFLNNWNYLYLDDDHNGTRDVPIFDSGFQRGVDEMPLEDVSPDNMQLEALGGMEQPNPAGIYVPTDEEGTTVTGGIYIKGDVSNLQLGVDASNNPQYTITQGSTTDIITVNYEADTTTVQSGSETETYSGIPDGLHDEGIVIYSENKIDKLYGVVQEDSKVTVSSEKDIVISNNITYQDYNPGPPINATGYENMLGIISWEGSVRIGTSTPNNVQIHAVVMAPQGVFTVDNYKSRPPQGTATLLGGAITDYYGAFAYGSRGYFRNFVYDARVLSGTKPPYFPQITNYTAEDSGLEERPVWKE